MKRVALALLFLQLQAGPAVAGVPPSKGLRVRISFSASAHAEAITGRVYVSLNRADAPATGRGGGGGPIQQAGPTGAPLFGVNVENLKPGAIAEIDGTVFGHPVASLNDIPKGEYLIQAFVNVYTKFDRADGHTVWLHMDQWEGQNWRRSPGNLFSVPKRVVIDPQAKDPRALVADLVCDQVIAPILDLPDTENVKRLKFKSEILSKWWGRPISVDATFL